MKIQILSVMLFIFPAASFASDKQDRLDAAYLAAGAFLVDHHQALKGLELEKAQLGDDLQKFDIQNEKHLNFSEFYQSGYEENFKVLKHEKLSPNLKALGKRFFESLLKDCAKPLCKKFNICKINCYFDVLGDVIDMIVSSRPELAIIKAPFQTFIIEKGMSSLRKLCPCK